MRERRRKKGGRDGGSNRAIMNSVTDSYICGKRVVPEYGGFGRRLLGHVHYHHHW